MLAISAVVLRDRRFYDAGSLCRSLTGFSQNIS